MRIFQSLLHLLDLLFSSSPSTLSSSSPSFSLSSLFSSSSLSSSSFSCNTFQLCKETDMEQLLNLHRQESHFLAVGCIRFAQSCMAKVSVSLPFLYDREREADLYPTTHQLAESGVPICYHQTVPWAWCCLHFRSCNCAHMESVLLSGCSKGLEMVS